MVEKDVSVKSIILPQDSELRVEVGSDKHIDIKLVDGFAELFGTELVKSKVYTISGLNFGVFTYHGCTLELIGDADADYISRETPMVSYLNVHSVLQQRRERAQAQGIGGPRVLIVGPDEVGKTTVSRILVNYGARAGGRMLFVNLDVAKGPVGVPGTIGAIALDNPLDIESGFSELHPVCYHFGHTEIAENTPHFHRLITVLGTSITSRCEADSRIKYSGVIVDTPTLEKPTLMHTVKELGIDVVLVLDHERLYSELSDTLADVTVVKLAKSGGVVHVSNSRSVQDSQIREYFYGPPKRRKVDLEMGPRQMDLSFDNVNLFKIGAPAVPASCLPFGTEVISHETQTVPVDIVPDLVMRCLTLSVAKPNWKEQGQDTLLESEAAGFLVITKVDMKNRRITLLSPHPDRLPFVPGQFLISTHKYADL